MTRSLILDLSTLGAYRGGVEERRSKLPPTALPAPLQRVGRRRSATGKEQERRKAWGRKWGALVAQVTSEIKEGD